MDNAGDWLYIVFLIIAAVSGLFSSKDKKKKSRPDILGQPDREIVPNDQPTEGKGFWEILEDMQKETQKPKPAPRQKQVKPKVEKPKVATSSSAPSPFLSAEKNIPNHIASRPSARMSAIEEEPGLMPEDEYDLAGFAVGVCDKKDMITGENLAAGDVLIGMASTGVHSNGFSLVRKVFDITKESLDTYYDDLGTTLGEALLAPTRIYVKALKSIKNAGVTVKACSHITGGGFYENIPRMLKEGTHAVVEKDSYPIPPIFAKLAKEGEIEEQMMYNTFNMGLGMVLAVDPADVDKTMDAIREAGDQPYVVGKIEAGEKGVTLC